MPHAPAVNSGASSASKTVLSVHDLKIAFARGGDFNEVVHGVSFDLRASETLAIVGESGSGKSVTALAVMRLLQKGRSRVDGSVLFEGRDILHAPDHEMEDIRGRDISMIFQEPMTSLNPVLDVGVQIGEVLRRHRRFDRNAARAEAVRLLDRVRVPHAAARVSDYPHQFSGGMRQRVMIAMALSCRPRVLIADEPTTALDVTIQAQILALISELQRDEDMAVLFITHDMGVVAEIADRTAVMYRGEIVESGRTADVFRAQNHAYTRSLLAAVPQLHSMAGKAKPERFELIDPRSGKRLPEQPARDGFDPSTEPLLEVTNLSTRFPIRSGFMGRLTGQVRAVDDVTFSIRPGETLSLVGESGSGKSTIGKSIIGLVPPTSGSIRLEGEELIGGSSALLRSARRKIQIIFQDPFASLDPRQSIGSAIAEPLLAHGLANRSEARGEVAAALVKVGLDPDMAARFPHEFSGGQRQRICFARILGLRPRLIIADESASALDVSVKARIINLMMDLQSELGLAYLFVSHDLAVVERISHRVAVLYKGRIVEMATRQSLFENPQHAYTRRLLDAAPAAFCRVPQRRPSVPVYGT